jgi:hypothetical protein
MTRSTRNLMAVHLAGNALLLWLAYYWLGLGESRTSSLLWSAVVALLLVVLTSCLHGATFAYFVAPVGQVTDLPRAFRTAVRNLLAILLAVLVVLLLYFLISLWINNSAVPGYNLSSWLTLKLRKPVRPTAIFRIFNVATWLVRWVILPVIMLPWIASIASGGWRGFRRRLATKRLYWIEAPVLLLCALWVPFLLLGWVPYNGNFTLEMVSFAIRLLVAYLLFVGAWLVLAFLTSGGKPALSQPITEAKP